MSQKNSWSSSSSGRAVEEVDNLTVAASVIRSLRASAAQQRYQLFAVREDQALVQGVAQLDTIIAAERDRVAAQQVKQRAADEALVQYMPSPFASPDSKTENKNSSEVRLQRNELSSDEEDDSEEEEATHRLAWQEEEEEEQQGSKERDSDDDIFMEDEDTEDLLTGFVAPTNALTMGMKSTSKPLPSISTSSSSSLPLPVAPRKLNPIRPVDVASSAIKKGVIIKPGQAIRVKPASRLKKN
eukprot:gene3176-3478_t